MGETTVTIMFFASTRIRSIWLFIIIRRFNISIYGALCNKRPRWAILLTWALLKNYSETCLIRSALGEEFCVRIDKYSETNNTYVGFDRFKWSDKTDRVNVMSCFVFFFQLYSSTKNSFSIIVSPWRGLCPSIWTNLNPFHFWFQSSCSGSGSKSLVVEKRYFYQ